MSEQLDPKLEEGIEPRNANGYASYAELRKLSADTERQGYSPGIHRADVTPYLEKLLRRIETDHPSKADLIQHLVKDRLGAARETIKSVREEEEHRLQLQNRLDEAENARIDNEIDALEQNREREIERLKRMLESSREKLNQADDIASLKCAAIGIDYLPSEKYLGSNSRDRKFWQRGPEDAFEDKMKKVHESVQKTLAKTKRGQQTEEGGTAEKNGPTIPDRETLAAQAELPYHKKELTKHALHMAIVWLGTTLVGVLIGFSIGALVGLYTPNTLDQKWYWAVAMIPVGVAVAVFSRYSVLLPFKFAKESAMLDYRGKWPAWVGYTIGVLVLAVILVIDIVVEKEGIIRFAQGSRMTISGEGQPTTPDWVYFLMAAVVMSGYLIYSAFEGVLKGRISVVDNKISLLQHNIEKQFWADEAERMQNEQQKLQEQSKEILTEMGGAFNSQQSQPMPHWPKVSEEQSQLQNSVEALVAKSSARNAYRELKRVETELGETREFYSKEIAAKQALRKPPTVELSTASIERVEQALANFRIGQQSVDDLIEHYMQFSDRRFEAIQRGIEAEENMKFEHNISLLALDNAKNIKLAREMLSSQEVEGAMKQAQQASAPSTVSSPSPAPEGHDGRMNNRDRGRSSNKPKGWFRKMLDVFSRKSKSERNKDAYLK